MHAAHDGLTTLCSNYAGVAAGVSTFAHAPEVAFTSCRAWLANYTAARDEPALQVVCGGRCCFSTFDSCENCRGPLAECGGAAVPSPYDSESLCATSRCTRFVATCSPGGWLAAAVCQEVCRLCERSLRCGSACVCVSRALTQHFQSKLLTATRGVTRPPLPLPACAQQALGVSEIVLIMIIMMPVKIVTMSVISRMQLPWQAVDDNDRCALEHATCHAHRALVDVPSCPTAPPTGLCSRCARGWCGWDGWWCP